VHPSIIGQDTWFQITYTSSGTTRYFSCQNARERDEWITSLKKTLMLTEDRRRKDNSLKLSVVEVKGLREKKRYYVEVRKNAL
jgi:RAS protein activator-like 2